MKKSIAIISSTIILLGLSACSPQKNENLNNQEQNNQEITENPSEKNDGTWGAVTVEQAVITEENTNFFLINFPESLPYTAGGGQLSQNSDDTMIMVGGENVEYYPKIDSVEDVLPSYAEEIAFNLGNYMGSRYANMDFVVENKELVEANGYTFCKYEGTYTFTYKKQPDSWGFVLYAVKLNKSGAYAYWIVIDLTEDESNKKLIGEHAYNMALTLQEK